MAWAQSCANHVKHIKCLSPAMCHFVWRDSSAIKFHRDEITFILALFHWLKPFTDERRGGNRSTLRKPLMTSFRKCHILKPENSSPKWDSNPHSSIGGRLGKQTFESLHHASPATNTQLLVLLDIPMALTTHNHHANTSLTWATVQNYSWETEKKTNCTMSSERNINGHQQQILFAPPISAAANWLPVYSSTACVCACVLMPTWNTESMTT